MFYSHEVLTSHKHGVATIWLVATLGPRTTSRKVNRKAILGVDVPRACDTIMNPEAPMALRLQGNLLYGVSRVYSRQCLYTLTDVQSMLDRMKTALKVVHGRGLNPDAGKAKPEELIVPYDPAFIPDFTLPGLDVDMLKPPESMLCRPDFNSSVISSHLSDSSPSPLGNALPQLNIPSPSFVAGEFGGLSFQSDSVNTFGDMALGEEGVLLRPDFDFDEEGNIVELAMGDDGLEVQIETPVRPQENAEVSEDLARPPQDEDVMVEDAVVLQDDNLIRDNGLDPRDSPPPTSGRLPDPDYVEGNARSEHASYGRKRRGPRKVQLDVSTQIPQAELVQSEQEYLQNMSRAENQKSYFRLVAQARKNATLWVSGHGIGSVGLGDRDSSVPHPLQSFCGEQLLAALSDGDGDSESEQGRKRHSSETDQGGMDSSRRVRRRTGEEVEMGLTHEYDADMLMQKDVELGLGAPASLPDEASSQMPWNTTASLQGSVAGSSSVPRPFDSFDRSSRRHFGRSNRLPGRFANLSPLAGRGLRQDLSGYDRLSSLSLDDFGDLNDNDMGAYMGEDADLFHDTDEADAAETQETVSSLGVTDRNFFDFLESRAQAFKRDSSQVQEISPQNAMTFSSIFPTESTSRSVATQALMHVLTLATKDVIRVSQRRATWGLPYSMDDLGEIYVAVLKLGKQILGVSA